MPDIRPLCPALSKIAEEELNEKPERIQNDLDTLREWIIKTPHLRARIDDQFLVTFLRGCKYSLERAKQKLDTFYTVRTLIPELIKNRDPMNERLQAMIRLGFGLPLPLTDKPDSPRVILIRPGCFDPSLFSIQDAMKVSTMMQDIMINEDDSFVVSGQIGVLDLSGVNVGHFMQFSPTFVKKMTVMTQDSSPIRQKGLHWINTPRGFESVFNIFTAFMNEKNRSRLFVHGNNMESLYKQVPRRLLPSEYGGEAGPLQNIINDWEKKIISYRQYFEEDDTFGVEEKKRVGVPKNSDALFGVEGTFRQLNFD
ncbi:unnamed protein product [Diamesa hyperborea]